MELSQNIWGVDSNVIIRAFKNRIFSLGRLREMLQNNRKRNVTDKIIRYIQIEII